MTGDQAEKRYYELYRECREAEDKAGQEYCKPIVQANIRKQSWSKLVAEIESEIVSTLILPSIEKDAMPVRNCSQCATYKTNHDVGKCEREGCPLKAAPAEVVEDRLMDAADELSRNSDSGALDRLVPNAEELVTSDRAFRQTAVQAPERPKRRGRPPKNQTPTN